MPWRGYNHAPRLTITVSGPPLTLPARGGHCMILKINAAERAALMELLDPGDKLRAGAAASAVHEHFRKLGIPARIVRTSAGSSQQDDCALRRRSPMTGYLSPQGAPIARPPLDGAPATAATFNPHSLTACNRENSTRAIGALRVT